MKEVSAHESVRRMYERLRSENLTNVWDRWEAQEQVRCKAFCAKGLSCQFCSNGPCRIIPGKLERGTCGIDGDAMAMRYMLLRNAMGLSTYTYHAREVAKTLIATGEGKAPFSIKDQSKLRMLAEVYGIDARIEDQKLAVEVGRAILREINADPSEPLSTLAFATKGRVEVWRRLGILPGGPANEQVDAVSHCLTNVDGDYVSLSKTAMRLALSCIYGAQIPLELGQDSLFGTPRPHDVSFDLGIVDPEYVNIVVNGHEPFVGVALIDYCRKAETQEMARRVGAKGIRVIGSIETGQEILQRTATDGIYVGMTGNWIAIEPLIATGAVDLFAMDMNCSPPSLEVYAKRFATTLVSVSPLVNVPGVEKHIDYAPAAVSSQVGELVGLAIENFRRRTGATTYVPAEKRNALVGFSVESILDALGGSLSPLQEAIRSGSIRGAVGLVSCTTLGNGPHDQPTITIAKELIRRDILVLSMGCGNAALQVAGLCSPEARDLAGSGLKSLCRSLGVPPVLSFGTCTDTGRLSILVCELANAFGVDVPDLPVAVTAPQYMEQKATIDAIFALALGALTHVSPTPPITGGTRLIKLLSRDLPGITGGSLLLEDDMAKAAESIAAHIESRRSSLGLP
ncbi:MAG: anaerobic carbon-monoxide dehydrogenase catalytic subunit [Candidatus Verstraetearchaeota archaeon]|nr:anaerobic carbon-monoxide dehydrogenase catalytic subunit [Candidatus Verstraetearchaeota archaeon]